jgi:transcriptional regulator with XRE-family HTH domain
MNVHLPDMPDAGTAHHPDLHFGAKLRFARIFRKLSQEALGRELGMSYQQIQKYEAGKNRISADMLYRIAKALGIKPEWFFEGLDAVKDEGQPPLLDAFQHRLLDALDRVPDERLKRIMLAFIVDVAERLAGQIAQGKVP